MSDPTLFRGLFAATFTPMTEGGGLALDRVPDVTEAILAQGAQGLFVCGSSGEFQTLAPDERAAVAQAYLQAVDGRVPVVVHVGSDSLVAMQRMILQAREDGATAVAMLPPVWMKPSDPRALVDFVADATACAADKPMLYYHIPALSGVEPDLVQLVRGVRERAPNLAGIKFTSPALDGLVRLTDVFGDDLAALFGVDEMLLAGAACGAQGAVGSTYNMLADVHGRTLAALERGDLSAARRSQRRATRAIHVMLRHGGFAGLKASMEARLGVDCGPPRLPHRPLDRSARDALARQLTAALASDESPDATAEA